MKPVLHIVTQCTDRKKLAVARELHLRRFRDRDLSRRAAAWAAALRTAGPTVELRDLYAGEHWVASLEIEALAAAKGFSPKLWVVSAGLGFVSADIKATGYSATFSSNVPDAVTSGSDGHAVQREEWMRLLQSHQNGPSLSQLAKRDRDAHFLVLLSRPYVQAVLPELMELRGNLESPEKLLLVTGEGSEVEQGPLSESWVQSSAKLRHYVGGSRIGQHARVAKALLAESAPQEVRASGWRRRVGRWLETAPELKVYDRRPMSELEVRLFARRMRESSWSRALKDLRASGRACEQKRFRQIFREEQAP